MRSIGDITPVQAQVSLKVSLNIFEKWQLTDTEKLNLLGLDSVSDLGLMVAGLVMVREDVLTRVSYVLQVHRHLRSLFSEDASVYGWVKKPNDHPLFRGRTAVEYIGVGGVDRLARVVSVLRSYVDAQPAVTFVG
ncbi:hypothetical protein A6E01_19495 (plasmid) [Vibrio breoganii]|uniref:Antitoxin Xre/MbcA/ParS-like toxin-binding domain-containing protein n=2 Tax=Vibrio breoganii TaxID=553239 RepID=A0AAN0Y000_9VIBR|nr:hypothetical protein A6E01_19495 [Vibrio breoganii]PML12818.1 hypothetical protein BCT84_01995 [Vibrio breoganii]